MEETLDSATTGWNQELHLISWKAPCRKLKIHKQWGKETKLLTVICKSLNHRKHLIINLALQGVRLVCSRILCIFIYLFLNIYYLLYILSSFVTFIDLIYFEIFQISSIDVLKWWLLVNRRWPEPTCSQLAIDTSTDGLTTVFGCLGFVVNGQMPYKGILLFWAKNPQPDKMIFNLFFQIPCFM